MVNTVFEFDEFKLDCGRFELYRSGRSLKLEKKPMELLILLVQSDGQLVSRDEIAQRLWDREVFVDTEHGINTAIRKIRLVLRDDPERARFVQTVTGKGYRFVSTVDVRRSLTEEAEVGSQPAVAAPDAIPSQNPPVNQAPLPGKKESPHSRFPSWLAILAGLTAIVCLVVAVIVVRRGSGKLLAHDAGAQIRSLAVLPLDNLSGEPGQNYLADGMTDELTTMLAKNSTLRVISRTSVMQYKGVHRPLPDIARELGVDGVLEGSVARAGGKVHMTIQLIQASSDTHLWAESYDRDANDVVSLPREAAQAIAKQLNRAVLQAPPARFVSPEAHDAYLRGSYLWFMGKNDEAGEYFRKATELQPDYALGWSGLSRYYGAGAVDGFLNPAESLPQEEAAAVKSLELDDSLAEAHQVMGAAYFYSRWDWTRAQAETARAIELDPRFAEAYHFQAKIFAALNRHQEAIAMQKKAMELDPFERPWAMALSLREARQYDAAINDLQQRLEADPQNEATRWLLYDCYWRKGAEKEAGQELEKVILLFWDHKVPVATVRRTLDQGGYKGLVRWQLSDAQKWSSTHYVPPVYLANLNAQLGRAEQALALLEQGYREHSPLLLEMQNDPAFDFLHTNERYRAIIKGMGLPPAY